MNNSSTSSSNAPTTQTSEGAPLIAPVGSGAIIDAPLASTAPETGLIDIDHFAKVELRVGQIVTA